MADFQKRTINPLQLWVILSELARHADLISRRKENTVRLFNVPDFQRRVAADQSFDDSVQRRRGLPKASFFQNIYIPFCERPRHRKKLFSEYRFPSFGFCQFVALKPIGMIGRLKASLAFCNALFHRRKLG